MSTKITPELIGVTCPRCNDKEKEDLKEQVKKLLAENAELQEALEMEQESRQQEYLENLEPVETPPHWSDKY